MSDNISDMLTRIRNAGNALLPSVLVPHSKLKASIAEVLYKEGYIAGHKLEGTVKKSLSIHLKYEGKAPVIEGIKRVSRPGLRVYVSSSDVPRVRGGLGVAIVSTSEGVMSGSQAKRKNLGGEVICYVW